VHGSLVIPGSEIEGCLALSRMLASGLYIFLPEICEEKKRLPLKWV
jgi:hypothetical protein